MDDADGEQRGRAAVVRAAEIRREGIRAGQLNAEADAEQQDQQGVEAAFQQPLLCPNQRVIEGRGGCTRRVDVVEIRSQHAEHRPSAQ